LVYQVGLLRPPNRGPSILNLSAYLSSLPSSASTETSCHLHRTKSEAVPATVRGGLSGCEMLTLGIRLRDDGNIVSPTHRPRSTSQKHYFPASGTHFCQRLSKSQGLVWPEALSKLKNSPHRVWNPRPSGLYTTSLYIPPPLR
jgi:hypothetical protein